MTIGAVLDEAWTLFTRFFLRFLAIALVVFATINLFYALVVTALDAFGRSRVAPLSAITSSRLRESRADTDAAAAA